ncbi:MAG: hypothetical protein R3C32_04220 [Chloroflexota bacterium]
MARPGPGGHRDAGRRAGLRTIRVQGRDAPSASTGPIFRDTIRLLPSGPRVRARALAIATGVVSGGGRIPLRPSGA